LNLLGSRETNIYGSQNFDSYLNSLKASFPKITIEYFQSNIEGEIINKIHESKEFDGIILNAAAYSHTSIGIADAVKSIDCKVIEVHISNTYSREEFRHNSFLSPVVDGIIIGFGLNSYKLGIESLVN
jgi:3-dehydroquinate dehydratase-2